MSKIKSLATSFSAKDFKEMTATMVAAMAAFMLFQPMSAAYAADLSSVLGQVSTLGAIIGGIILVIVLVKGIADYIKGEGTIGKIIVKVLCILLLVGLMVVAGNIETLKGTFGTIASGATDVATNTATTALS